MSYECSCDYGPPTWCNIRNVKAARKPHECYECRAPIFAGEPYEYTSGLWEGTHQDFHTCTRCVDLRQWATISVPCFCWAFGDLHENVREMVRETARHVPGFFMEYGRRMIRIRQERARRETLAENPSGKV